MGKAWSLQPDGDPWKLLWEGLLSRGPDSVTWQKVKGHAKGEHIARGEATEETKNGNVWADHYATKGITLHDGQAVQLAKWLQQRHKGYAAFVARVQIMLGVTITIPLQQLHSHFRVHGAQLQCPKPSQGRCEDSFAVRRSEHPDRTFCAWLCPATYIGDAKFTAVRLRLDRQQRIPVEPVERRPFAFRVLRVLVRVCDKTGVSHRLNAHSHHKLQPALPLNSRDHCDLSVPVPSRLHCGFTLSQRVRDLLLLRSEAVGHAWNAPAMQAVLYAFVHHVAGPLR